MPERNEPWEYYPFIKWYSKNWLHGSIRFDCTPEERSVFHDLVCMANESRSRGIIRANSETPYPHKYISEQLNIPLKLLEHCLEKFESQGRIHQNDVGITIINFAYYQGLDTKRQRGRPRKNPNQLSFDNPAPPELLRDVKE
jgi:hypothetical protein